MSGFSQHIELCQKSCFPKTENDIIAGARDLYLESDQAGLYWSADSASDVLGVVVT